MTLMLWTKEGAGREVTDRFVNLETFPLIPVQICFEDPCGYSVLM